MPDGRFGVLVSGRGSNFAAIAEASRAGAIDATCAVVVSNVPGAPALERAASWGIPSAVVDSKAVRPREAHERRVAEILEEHRCDLVCLAGYMRRLSPFLVGRFRGRILNVHPALLPAFPGLDAQRQALEHGAKVAGCTVHFVDEDLDHGPIVLQAAVPVLEDDTVESLSARILVEEHRIYPEAVALYFQRRLEIRGRRVVIRRI